MGFAGACRPLQQTVCNRSLCLLNLRKFRQPEKIAEWSRLLQLSWGKTPGLLSSLSASMAEKPATCPNEAVNAMDSKRSASMDPFQALKYAEMTADSIAQLLAPRHIRRLGEVGKGDARRLAVTGIALETYIHSPSQPRGMAKQYAHTTRAPALSLPTRGGGSDLQT